MLKNKSQEFSEFLASESGIDQSRIVEGFSTFISLEFETLANNAFKEF